MTTERFEAQVGADIREFKRKMKQVDKEIRDLATGVDVDLDLATEEFYAEMQAVKKQLKGVDGKQARIEVELAYMEFKRQMAELYAIAETLDDYDIDVEVDLAINEFRKKLALAKMLAQGLDDADIELDLDTSRFYRKYFQVGAAITALTAKDIVLKLKMDYRNFQQTMGRVASQMRNWGEIFSTMLMGSLISMIPLLSPLISSLVGLIGSLGVMIGVVAGQFLILTAGIATTALAFGGLAAVAIPTIKTLFDETAKLNAEQQKARSAWDGLVDAYDQLVAKTEGAVLEAFTYAMNATQSILEQLEPMIVSTADSLVRLMDAFNTSVNTKPIQAIFNTFNEFGAGIFENVVKAIGNFIAGIGSLIAALTPAASTWSKNFAEMGRSFAEWAAGLSQSEKFQTFISYVQEYMPLVSKIFGDLVVGIVEFFTAFSDLGGDFMVRLSEMVEGFREWAAALSENQAFQDFVNYIRESTPEVLKLIGNLISFLVNFGVAMAPVGAVVMSVVNSFLEWMNSMMETHSWFSQLIGIIPTLIGGFMMIVAPLTMLWTLFGTKLVAAIKLAMNVLKSLGSAFGRVIPYITPLIDDVARLIGWFGRIGATVASLAGRALPLLGRAFTVLGGPIGWIIGIITTLISVGVWLYKNWDTVKAYAVSIWGAIKNFFSSTIPSIYNTVKDWFGKVANVVGEKMGEAKQWVEDKWNEAVSYLQSIDLTDIGKNIIQGLINGLEAVPVVGTVIKIGKKIVDTFRSAMKIKSPSRVMTALAKWIPAGVVKGIESGINSVKSATQKLASAVNLDFSETVKKSSSAFKNLMSIVKSTATANAKLVKETTKVNGKEVTKYVKKTNAERFEAFEQALSEQKKWSNLSLAEERAYWLQVANHLKKGSAAQRKALENAADLKSQMLQAQYNKEVNYIDKAAKYQAMSLRDQIRTMQNYMKQYKVGSEQQIAYEEMLYDTKKQLYDDVKSITSQYLDDVKSKYDSMIEEEKRLRDAWKDTYNARKDTLAKTWGLFDEVKLTDMIEFDDEGNITKQIDLIQNMRDQVSTMSDWMHDMFRLESFGLDQALIEELRAAGPKAAAEIKALANMSANELKEYERLWQTMSELAGKQATHELEASRLEMEAEVEKLHLNTAKELERMKNAMLEEVNEMVNGSSDKFNVLTMTLPEIGKKAMQGLVEGIKSMDGVLQSTLSQIADSASKSLSKIMSGVQFNADNLTPIVSGSLNLKSNVDNSNFAQPIVNVNVYQELDADVLKTRFDEQDAMNAKVNIKKG